jgi:ABC-type uncharacterized transport system involved in gliding motility auxiliary subunit
VRSDWLQARQTRYAAYATTYILIIIAVLVVANILADRYNKSFDATANKRFSLSDQTAKIVKGLKQDANVTFYGEPSRFQEARDLLDRYANLSHKLHVNYVDFFKNPGVVRAANIKNPGTVAVDIGPKHEEAKGLTEEGVTGALIRDLKGGERTVCLISGSGEHQLESAERTGYSKLKELLEHDNYKSKSINLLQKAEVPSDCTVILVGGPTGDYVQPAVDAIKTYIENGGRAMFLLDPPLHMGRSEISDNEALTNILASWGVTVDKDLILDLNPVGQMVGLGPQVPLVTSYESHPIVSDLKGTATGFPLSRSLEIKNGAKTNVQKLFGSSDSSFATMNLSSPEVQIDPNKDKKGPLAIGAAGSYNTGKENSQGRFVVVGSSNWIANSFITFNGNRDLLLNMMNWLSSDEDLISIRPKEPEDRRITLTRAQMNMIRIVSQFGLPLIVVIAGVFMWWRRR